MKHLYIRSLNDYIRSVRIESTTSIEIKKGDKLFFNNEENSFYFQSLNHNQDLRIVFRNKDDKVISFHLKNILNLINENSKENEDNITTLSIANSKKGFDSINDRLYNLDLDEKTITQELQIFFQQGKQKDGFLFDNFNDLTTYIKNTTLNPLINYEISKHINDETFIQHDYLEKTAKKDVEIEEQLDATKHKKIDREKEIFEKIEIESEKEETDSSIVYVGTSGSDTFTGGSGNDTISGAGGADELYGGNGDDTISGDNGNDTISGEDGDDILDGGNGEDFVKGGKGDDIVSGGYDDDLLYGGYGDDTLYGNFGSDDLRGHEGNDTLYGNTGDDLLIGGYGDDVIDGGFGDDTVKFSGTLSEYTFIYSGSTITITDSIAGRDGTDTITNVEEFKFTNVTKSYSYFSGSTPLVLDLDNDGIETLNITNGVTFDIDADGDLDLTGWVASDDGLLVRDINQDGIINDASELFGEETLKEDGTKASDGFEALRELDSNKDGVINSEDEAFNELQVWKDSNSNGITDEGELLSLEEAEVASISLQAEESNEIDNGNLLGLVGTYTTTEDETQNITDVWFLYEENNQEQTIDLTSNNVNSISNIVDINIEQELSFEDFIYDEEYIFLEENEDISIQEGLDLSSEENITSNYDNYVDSNTITFISILEENVDIQDI